MTSDLPPPPRTEQVVARALEKLRTFVATLEPDERAVLAALLAPAVADAYAPDGPQPPDPPATDGGAGGTETWRPERLTEALAGEVRDQRMRIEFG